ncbi:MAG: TetR/AcrR family transcriptional regulator, partial [Myxococcota bacterium]
ESKDALVLALYAQLADAFTARLDETPTGTWAARADAALDASFEVLKPHRDTLGALLGAMLSRRGDGIYVPWAANQARVRQGFVDAVAGARDAPRNAESLGDTLYLVHLGALLFWLLDRSEDQSATDELRAFLSRTTPLLGMALSLPLVKGPLDTLVGIVRRGVYGIHPPEER